MPAPTALLRDPDQLADTIAEQPEAPLTTNDADEEILIDPEALPDSAPAPLSSFSAPEDGTMELDLDSRPKFAPSTSIPIAFRIESRKVPVPPHRLSPLKTAWPKMYPPLVEHLKLQVRMNVKNKAVELRTSKATTDAGALQKGEDFVKAFTLGFDIDDAIALLRLDDLYIETFEIKDIKTLNGDHKSRAIGRIAGKDGKTKVRSSDFVKSWGTALLTIFVVCNRERQQDAGSTGGPKDPYPRRLQEHPHRTRSHRESSPRSTARQGVRQPTNSRIENEGTVLVCS